jgi:hypothetical protein
LRVGREAQAWDAPGVAQAACDGIGHAALAHLGLGAQSASQVGAAAVKYPADRVQLLVREDAPWLHELAKTVAAALSRVADAVAVKLVSRDEWRERRQSRNFALAVDVTRLYANSPSGVYATLAAADDRTTAARLLARSPRLSEPVNARALTRLMRIGVLGELHFQGGKIPDLTLPQLTYGGPDFGAAFRGRAPGGN